MQETDIPSRDWMLSGFGAAAFVLSGIMALLTWQVFCAIPLLVGLACLIAGLRQLTPSAKSLSFRIGLVSLFMAFAVALGLIQFANRLEGYPVQIIIPVGYKGKFGIVIDKATGQTPKLVDGVWLFKIPPSGTLSINDDTPLRVGHEEDYYFANGQKFNPTQQDTDSTGPNGDLVYWTIVP